MDGRVLKVSVLLVDIRIQQSCKIASDTALLACRRTLGLTSHNADWKRMLVSSRYVFGHHELRISDH